VVAFKRCKWFDSKCEIDTFNLFIEYGACVSKLRLLIERGNIFTAKNFLRLSKFHLKVFSRRGVGG
jgi:hypothetical protein